METTAAGAVAVLPGRGVAPADTRLNESRNRLKLKKAN
jgi:hypothetical protein